MKIARFLRSCTSIRSRRAAFLVVFVLLIGIIWAAWPRLWSIAGFGAKSSISSVRRAMCMPTHLTRMRVPVSRTLGTRLCTDVIARSPRPIARTRWADRWHRWKAMRRARRSTLPPGLPFEAKGVQYSVEQRDGRVFHKMTRRDAEGKVFAETQGEVRYALGSGTRGITFLIERDGFLFQSPIAWFAQQRAMGCFPRLRGVRHAAKLRAPDPARVPVLPRQPIPPRGRDAEPL